MESAGRGAGTKFSKQWRTAAKKTREQWKRQWLIQHDSRVHIGFCRDCMQRLDNRNRG